MRGRMRIHMISIGIITAVVTVMYLLFAPKQVAQKVEFSGSNYVQVNSATWGLNCNTHIDHEIKQAQIARAKLPVTERDTIEIPKIVTRNNALSHLSTLCNGKEICSFLTEADVIGLDPVYSCFKELEISYRCFDIDRLRQAKFRQGEFAKIDCSKATIGNP